MTKRRTRNPSALFRKVLVEAEQQLALDSSKASNFEHKGIRGNVRAAALSSFLSLHLPGVFTVGKGEARDFKDRVTGELDLFIYDRWSAAPIQTEEDAVIVPAEALYAVIEVKSVLSQAELEACYRSAAKIRALAPFKKQFVAAPLNGEAQEGRCRCPYFVFAYSSNLSAEDWAEKEHQRTLDCAKVTGCEPDLIDRVVVIDRGILRPQIDVVLLKDGTPSIFLEFYLHLVNYLVREQKRRPPVDWMMYTSSSSWTKLRKVK